MTKEVSVSKGNTALVDDEDFERITLHKWSYHNNGYAKRNIGRRSVYMHREVMNDIYGEINMDLDHINGNKLDNRKCNLRFCSHSENLRNKKIPKNNTSGHKGVRWDKKNKKWLAGTQYNNKYVFLGRFDLIEDASKAFVDFAKKTYGEFFNKKEA